MLLELEMHRRGIGIKGESDEHYIYGYQGKWARSDWREQPAPEAEEAAGFTQIVV